MQHHLGKAEGHHSYPGFPDHALSEPAALDEVRLPATRLHTASDAALLKRCRHGDAAAWDILVRRYEALVFGVALSNRLTREEAADITQTTFIALLDAIDDLNEDERLAGWLATVARRSAWRVRRDAIRHRDLSVPASDSVDPIAEWEQVVWLHESLQLLAEPCRELLTALYLDPAGSSYKEVARRTGRAIGTLGPMRARCLAHLRAIMTEGLDR